MAFPPEPMSGSSEKTSERVGGGGTPIFTVRPPRVVPRAARERWLSNAGGTLVLRREETRTGGDGRLQGGEGE